MIKHELLATLRAYREVAHASWPELCASMDERMGTWAGMGEDELRAELAMHVQATEAPGFGVRVFWKVGPELAYGGCNIQFARDAGLAGADGMVGRTDFDDGTAWAPQAAKYRRDDREVIRTGAAKLDIVERQQSAAGVLWLRTGKAPIRLESGHCIGIFGMYEVIDEAAAARLNLAKNRPRSDRPPS